jgi:hypothetical protein
MWRALRRRVLTPSTKGTKLSVRGFYEKSPETRDMLEQVGAMFLVGYSIAAGARSTEEAEDKLEELPPQFQGFAYEGAGMGFAMRDGLPFGGTWVERFVESRHPGHVYMVYVGVGWAMARLPRFRWARATGGLSDPVLRWLALDGYGFHQAYFHTEKYVRRQYQEPDFPWPPGGPASYASRVIDQGIGRATWFVCGADPGRVAQTLNEFPAARRPDLYSGAGLAATYAGAADEDELRVFRQRGSAYVQQIAQGSAFAATARFRTGLVTPHTELAARILCGTTPGRAAEVCEQTLPAASEGGGVPAYELWRQRIASGLMSRQDTSI